MTEATERERERSDRTPPKPNGGASDALVNWIGVFGTILGILVGGGVTYLVGHQQIQQVQKSERRSARRDLRDAVVSLHANLQAHAQYLQVKRACLGQDEEQPDYCSDRGRTWTPAKAMVAWNRFDSDLSEAHIVVDPEPESELHALSQLRREYQNAWDHICPGGTLSLTVERAKGCYDERIDLVQRTAEKLSQYRDLSVPK